MGQYTIREITNLPFQLHFPSTCFFGNSWGPKPSWPRRTASSFRYHFVAVNMSFSRHIHSVPLAGWYRSSERDSRSNYQLDLRYLESVFVIFPVHFSLQWDDSQCRQTLSLGPSVMHEAVVELPWAVLCSSLRRVSTLEHNNPWQTERKPHAYEWTYLEHFVHPLHAGQPN